MQNWKRTKYALKNNGCYKKDYLVAIKVAAHSIVGVSGSLFAPVLSDQALELETNTESVEQVLMQMPKFKQTVKTTIAWLQAVSDELG